MPSTCERSCSRQVSSAGGDHAGRETTQVRSQHKRRHDPQPTPVTRAPTPLHGEHEVGHRLDVAYPLEARVFDSRAEAGSSTPTVIRRNSRQPHFGRRPLASTVAVQKASSSPAMRDRISQTGFD